MELKYPLSKRHIVLIVTYVYIIHIIYYRTCDFRYYFDDTALCLFPIQWIWFHPFAWLFVQSVRIVACKVPFGRQQCCDITTLSEGILKAFINN